MQTDIDLQDIQQVLAIAGISGFNGDYIALGGGEVNNTYRVDCGSKQLILRVAKDEGQRTLENEAKALGLLDSPHIPKLVFFDANNLLNNRVWILESYIPGISDQRLTVIQFKRLGSLLAEVHRVSSTESRVNLKEQFLDNAEAFGDKQYLLNHPDPKLRILIQKAFEEFKRKQSDYDHVMPTLIHLDATPSNILVNGDDVGLIDWEFSKFNDPMSDFSTVYYEDIEYNQGKWRIQIRPDEKAALFEGYESAGGKVDEERIRFWIRFDKLGAAVFLYWRLHVSKRITNQAQTEQYQLDFDDLVDSLFT